jgi:hypothetical protein
MVYTRSRKFCCCLPVRFGVFVMAILGFLGGTLVAAAGIIEINRTKVGKTSLVIQIAMYLILALVSFFGLIAATTRRRKLVAIFWAMLTAHLVFSIISGIFVLNAFFKNAPQNVDICIDGSENKKTIYDCNNGENIVKALMISIFVTIWLVQVYACIIVDNYTKFLSSSGRSRPNGGDRDLALRAG